MTFVRSVLAAVVIVIALGLLTSSAGAGPLADPGRISPDKQTILDRQAAQRAREEQGPRAPKHPDVLRDDNLVPSDVKIGIFPYRGIGPFKGGRNFVNAAQLVGTNGRAYTVYAGASELDATQAVFLIYDGRAGDAPQTLQLSPRSGAVHLDVINGDSITFTTPTGRGSIDVVTGTIAFAAR